MRLFDDFGNFVGDFAPAASFDGCLVSLAIYIVIFFIFLVYYYFACIVDGVKGVKNKDEKEMLKLIYPAVVTIIIAGYIIRCTFITYC
ncbi:hypothetical protein ACFL15_02465 [Patescibacteria group bacterium]